MSVYSPYVPTAVSSAFLTSSGWAHVTHNIKKKNATHHDLTQNKTQTILTWTDIINDGQYMFLYVSCVFCVVFDSDV